MSHGGTKWTQISPGHRVEELSCELVELAICNQLRIDLENFEKQNYIFF